jgi:hypothetical protein
LLIPWEKIQKLILLLCNLMNPFLKFLLWKQEVLSKNW